MISYLKYILFITLALLLNCSKANAQDYVHDAAIARVVLNSTLKRKFMEDGYEAQLIFSKFDTKKLTEKSYNVVLTLWAEPSCTTLFSQPQRVKTVNEFHFDSVSSFKKPLKFFIRYTDLSTHMTKYNFGNYREGRMFWSLELFRVDTNQRCLFMKPQIRTDAKVYYNGFFDYHILDIRMNTKGALNWNDVQVNPKLGEHPTEDLVASDYTGELVHLRYEPYDGQKFDALDEFVVDCKFYHDINRTKPCMFYEFTQEFDDKGHNRLYYAKEQWSAEAYKTECIEDRSQPTNSIKRVRHDWKPFDIFVPHSIIYYADEDVKKTQKGENDTIYMFPDLYGKDGMLYRKASFCYKWVRYPMPKDTACYHSDQDSTETILSREQMSPTEVLVTYNLKLKCKKCGHVTEQNNLQRVEFVKPEFTMCPPHAWEDYLGEPIYDEIKNDTSKNGCLVLQKIPYHTYKKCILCDERKDGPTWTDWNTYPNLATDSPNCCNDLEYEDDVEEQRTQLVGGEQVVKTITTYAVCKSQNKKWVEGVRTETEFVPCKPHKWKFIEEKDVSFMPVGNVTHKVLTMALYECEKCGMKDYRYAKSTCLHSRDNYIVECQQVYPFKAVFKGVPIKMHLVVNKEDSSAVYVAETEVTEGLWAAVYPNNHRGWSTKSNYPAANVSFQDATLFIQELNMIASKEKWPLRFRLPTAEEWKNAYAYGGGDKEGWLVYNSEGRTHPVAELAANEALLYDMKGNVSEMCSDTLMVKSEDSMQSLMAVAGNNYQDSPSNGVANGIRWMDISTEDPTIGFRLVADPVESEDADLVRDYGNVVGEKSYITGYHWTMRKLYHCDKCGRTFYGNQRGTNTTASQTPKKCDKIITLKK